MMPKNRKKKLPTTASVRKGLTSSQMRVARRLLMWQREIWPAVFDNGSHQYHTKADLSRALGYGPTAVNAWFGGNGGPNLTDFMLMTIMLKTDPAVWLPSREYLLGREPPVEARTSYLDLVKQAQEEIHDEQLTVAPEPEPEIPALLLPPEVDLDNIVDELAKKIHQRALEKAAEMLVNQL